MAAIPTIELEVSVSPKRKMTGRPPVMRVGRVINGGPVFIGVESPHYERITNGNRRSLHAITGLSDDDVRWLIQALRKELKGRSK